MQQAATLADFVQHLENYCGLRGLVVDGTGNNEKLDFSLSYQSEDPQSLLRALTVMGLGIVKQQREVTMLVLQP